MRAHRDPPGRTRRRRAPAGLRPRPDGVRPWHYVPVLARKPARCATAHRSRTGSCPPLSNGSAASSPAAPTAPARWRDPHRRARRRPVRGRSGLRRGTARGRVLGRRGAHILARQREPPAPVPLLTPERPAAAPRAGRRLCPLRQPEDSPMMERQQILATIHGELKLFGMKAAYDEIIKVAQTQPRTTADRR